MMLQGFARSSGRRGGNYLILRRAISIQDLRVPPGNRLEELKGRRKGQHSIRINDQWQICFSWREGDALKLRSSAITEESKMTTKRLEPIHPGEILEEEFMRPLGLSENAVAKRIDVPVTRISEIVRGRRGITADTALRLAHLLGTSPDLWLGLQTDYDLRVARRDLAGAILARIVPVKGPSSKYGEGASRSPSAVAEEATPYAKPQVLRRDRDRRRIRRAPSNRGAR